MVDVVTVRRVHLHGELLGRLAEGQEGLMEAELYAAAYRPVEAGWADLCRCVAGGT